MALYLSLYRGHRPFLVELVTETSSISDGRPLLPGQTDDHDDDNNHGNKEDNCGNNWDHDDDNFGNDQDLDDGNDDQDHHDGHDDGNDDDNFCNNDVNYGNNEDKEEKFVTLMMMRMTMLTRRQISLGQCK